ncbi:hypothetical protein CHLRE_09g395300v5 [Chlamydomonas reinhardtii]|uniref:MAGE domain-containing protein n=1 Tax=Chlamydomonas reinhardtii TaxID=3055 RepID=A0A2K3DD81_CHLRE|nr:uncharacterized protein CHLRE_09g395300v5 [Chlamydomonas reinhardtii]PNW78491.1 hypothetical protein CHLRE_09g395300v5 [Chlamydomonas reinhardtii]
MSDDGDDGLGEEDEPRRGGRGGAGAARGRRGGLRGGGRAGLAGAGAARGRGARGGRGGGGSATAGGAAGAASDDSDVVIISSDSDDGAAGAQAGASMAPPAAAAGGRGGRGAARGRGRGRGRGASQSAPAGADDGNGSDDDAERDGGGQAGGSGGAAGRGTQAQGRQGAAARFASATEPLQIDSKELAAMRRKIKRYHEEYQDAAAKCDVWNEVSNATKQELARVVVRYMLFATRAKPGVPVARGKLTDAIKKALGNQRHHRKLASVWLPWARHMAISTLGLDIDDLAPRPEPKMGAGGAAATAAGASGSADDVPAAPATPVTAAAAPGNQHFVLRTALPTVLRLQVVGQGAAPGEGGDDWALTSVVLALIRVNNNKMEETQLKRLLDQLGFQEGQPHPVLGSLDAQLKRMMDQRYIVADRNTTMQADGRHERLLLWGDAALSETGPKAIDDMIESWFELKDSAAATADDEEGAAGAADADQQ